MFLSIHLVDFTWPSQPSYQLSNALFSIISSLDDLGLSRTELIKAGTVDAVLSGFRSAVAEHVLVKEPSWRRADVQLLWDLMLLSHLGDTLPAHDLQQKLEDLERKVKFLPSIRKTPSHTSCSCNFWHQKKNGQG